jgi:hypothetical protein
MHSGNRQEPFMTKLTLRVCFLALGFFSTCLVVSAQEIVHALAGTVTAINLTAKTITVTTDDGSEGLFKDATDSRKSVEFSKNIRAEATPAAEFKASGMRAIVFYYGTDSERTVVALRSLGAGPFEKTTGTLVNFNRGARTITIQKPSGERETFHIDAQSVAETSVGAAEGDKLDASSGDNLRVTSTTVNGVKTILFIVPA